jgi:hypothetical protein
MASSLRTEYFYVSKERYITQQLFSLKKAFLCMPLIMNMLRNFSQRSDRRFFFTIRVLQKALEINSEKRVAYVIIQGA